MGKCGQHHPKNRSTNWINSQKIFIWSPILFQRKWRFFSQIFSYYWRICAGEKPFNFVYRIKLHRKSINGRLSRLEGGLHSIMKNKIKTFTPFGNELLTPSKNISLAAFPIIYPMKQKDLYDYYPRCTMPSGLRFYKIIMNIIRNTKLARHNEENDCLFTQIENNIIYIYRRSLQDFYWKKGAYKCLEVPGVHFH